MQNSLPHNLRTSSLPNVECRPNLASSKQPFGIYLLSKRRARRISAAFLPFL